MSERVNADIGQLTVKFLTEAESIGYGGFGVSWLSKGGGY
jgi:hypothetical protein